MFKNSCIVLLACLALTQAVVFEVHNNAHQDIWVGIMGNPGKSDLGGSFKLAPGQARDVDAPADWAGRMWPKSSCDDQGNCETGDCGDHGCIPSSLAEIALNVWGGLDYYDISFVDGFNMKLSLMPLGRHGDDSQHSCRRAACDFDINTVCPPELQIKSQRGNGVIGCKSACNAFNTDEYCCRNAYGLSGTCKSSDWPVDYPQNIFKNHCPDAYTSANDNKSTFTCPSVARYRVTFG